MGTLASTLITRCLDNLAKAGAGTTRSGITVTTLGITWLNNAMLALARKHDFKELTKTYTGATVTSQKTYSQPASTKILYNVRVQDGTNSRKLIPVIQKHLDRVVPYPEGETTGIPVWYSEYGQSFDVLPLPDAVYTMYVRVQLWPTTVTATTDTITYNSDKDDIIVAYMTKEAFQHYQMYEDAKIWNDDFKLKIKDAILTDDAQPDWDPVARGFNSARNTPFVGEPWNSPFVWRIV